MTKTLRVGFLALSVCVPLFLSAQTQNSAPSSPTAPAWAQPGSATHTQTAPPPDFHRPSRNFDTPIGIFDGQSDIGSAGVPGGATPDSLVGIMAKRIGIEKRGDSFALFVSEDGEAMHQFGAPITLHLAAPFYVGIGFCSHLPDKSDTAVLSNVVLENAAGKVR